MKQVVRMFRNEEEVPEGAQYLKTLFLKVPDDRGFGYKMEVVHYFLVAK